MRRSDDNRSGLPIEEKPSRRFSLESRLLVFLSHTWRWLVYGLFAAGLFVLIRPLTTSHSVTLAKGDIPEDNIYATVQFTYEDKAATEAYRNAAVADTLPVFNQPVLLASEAFTNRLAHLFNAAREVAASTAAKEATETFDPLPALHDRINFDLSDKTLLTLYDNQDIPEFEKTINRIVAEIQEQMLIRGVVATEVGFKTISSATRGITLRREGKSDAVRPSTEGIISREMLVERIHRQLDKEWPPTMTEFRDQNEAGREIAEIFISPTLFFDPEATEKAQSAARDFVKPVLVIVKKGEIIVEKGKPVSYHAALALKELAKTKGREGAFALNLGWAILAMLPVIALWGYLRRYEPYLGDDPRMVTVLAFIMLLVVGWAKLGYLLQNVVDSPILTNLTYATPVAMAGILVTVLANGWLGTFIVSLLAFAIGIMHWNLDMKVAAICLMSGIVSAYSVSRIHRRTALYRAGLWTGVAAVLMVLGINFIENPTSIDLMANKQDFFFAITWAILNALQSCAFASFLLVPLEAFLGVVTDIKLLEIGVKSDLLKELEEKAPGSYQHSLNVATLAESAAEAIGSNSLLCRVGAYYHDIGKMEMPMYFTENQRTEQDRLRHEKLSPNMSCLIIRNHVKDGLERARKEKLPRAIQAFIAEHHGTTRIGFFYERAVASNDPGVVAEEDFRYPGPKPQTVESAILMIADSIEATFRSMGPVTDGETVQMVRKIINEKFIDGQFEECALTLRDLHKLSQAFTRALINMRHQRVEYPALTRAAHETDILRVGRTPSRTAPARNLEV